MFICEHLENKTFVQVDTRNYFIQCLHPELLLEIKESNFEGSFIIDEKSKIFYSFKELKFEDLYSTLTSTDRFTINRVKVTVKYKNQNNFVETIHFN